MIVGALSPWARTLGVRADSSQDEFVLLLAIVAGFTLVLLAASERRWLAVIPILTGLTAAALTANDIRDPRDLVAGISGHLVTVDWGIYLALVGSASLVLATMLLVAETARSRTSAAERSAARVARAAEKRESRWRAGFAEVASRITPYIAHEAEGAVFILPTRQRSGIVRFATASPIQWKEKRHLERALKALKQARARASKSIFVDVGAHIGTTTIAAMHWFGFESAIAIEPEPENLRLLRANLALNGLGEAIEVFGVAASNRTGTEELVLQSGAGSKHHLAVEGEKPKSSMQVPLIRLDSLVEDGRVDPGEVGLLWLDVEGHELEVLQGASSLLEHAPPIVMEFAPDRLAHGRLASLRSLVAEHYTHLLDLRLEPSRGPDFRPLDSLDELAERYRRGFTDLLFARLPDDPAISALSSVSRDPV